MRTLTCLLFFLATTVTFADEARYQAYLSYQSMIDGGRVQANWLPDGSSFWYERGGPNHREVVKVDAASGDEADLFDVPRLRSALESVLGYEPAGNGVPFAMFQFAGPSAIAFVLDGKSFVMDLETYTPVRQPAPSPFGFELVVSEAERAVPGMYMREKFQGLGPLPSPEAMSPDGKWIAGVENHNLTLRGTIDGQARAVTHDGNEDNFWDVEAALWQPWSPSGEKLAVIKQHAAGMPKIATVKWLQPLEYAMEVRTIPAGAELYRSELYIHDIHSGKPEHVDLGDNSDHFVRPLAWLPDGSELIVAKYSRVLDAVELLGVNAYTLEVRSILIERSDTFLTNHHEAIWAADTGFYLLPDGSGFIWHSERSGWDHLYHYNMSGRLVRQLTSGDWRVEDIVRVDLEGGWVYFYGRGNAARPYDLHLYRVGLSGRDITQLTEGEGQHVINMAPSAAFFVDSYSSVSSPPVTELRQADGALVKSLGEADISRLEAAGYTPLQEHVVKAADGETDLWVTMYLPGDFDESKKYPVVEYIYAGPQTTMRPMDFGDNLGPYADLLGRTGNFTRALAQLGFVVVVLDGRGTPGRSKAFHDAVYMNWGQFEISDHAGALRQLGERFDFMDMDRVGIFGGSWGGHFTVRALAQAPEIYKVGISQVPGYGSRKFILYEAYLGMPQENKAGYDAADAIALAPQIEGELMQIGGINDTGTQADLFLMSEHLIRLGKQHEMMVYPNTGHGAPGVTGEFDMEFKRRYLVEKLKP